MNESKSDPANYHKCSEPFESLDACSEALAAFYEEISEARKKYKMADCMIVVMDTAKNEDGITGKIMNMHSYGSALNVGTMAAYAYGVAQKDRAELIAKLLAQKA